MLRLPTDGITRPRHDGDDDDDDDGNERKIAKIGIVLVSCVQGTRGSWLELCAVNVSE
jgi:hypothetical protein